jgi:hypothetical protein
MKLQLGSRVQSIDAKGLSATLASGHVLHADLIIGADGVKVSGTQSSGVNFTRTLKHRNKSVLHLVLFCDFLGPVFIQWESASTSEVLLLALGTLAR